MKITSREQTTAEYFLRYMVENNSRKRLFCKEKYICIPTKIALEIADAIEKSREKVNVVTCQHCKWWKPFNDEMGHCGCDMTHKDFYCKRGINS